MVLAYTSWEMPLYIENLVNDTITVRVLGMLVDVIISSFSLKEEGEGE